MADFYGNIASKVLEMETAISVVIPEGVELSNSPVIYLLHGLSDNHSGWRRYTRVESYARKYQAILIMPEVQRSFYTNEVYGSRYFTYVHEELPEIINQLFRINQSPDNTYIMGLSMGGYGAMKCAFTTPEKYAGCAAFSSVADLKEAVLSNRFRFRESGEEKACFGGNQIEAENDLFYLSKKCYEEKRIPRTFLTCGKQDELFAMNEKLTKELKRFDWDLEYRTWDGTHSWDFWDESIKQAMEYFFGER